MSSRKIRWAILCIALVLLMAALGMSFRTTAQSSTASELMEIAEESLNTQYQALVSGDIDTALKGKRFGHLFRAAIGNQLSAQVAMRAALMKTRQDFKGFRTKLLFQEVQVDGDKAKLKATEITELDMDPPPGGPKVTKSSDPHVFDFARIDGEWHLINDLIVRPAPVLPKDTGDLPSIPLPRPTTDGAIVAAANSPNKPGLDIQIQPGTKVPLTGVDWSKNDQTLVLAISSKCHFCTESAPFYQRLAREHGKTHLIAVLPQTVEESKKYLEGLGVTIDDIKQTSLASLGIRATPTLILIDRNGGTIKSWVGKLKPDREAEVIGSFQ